MAGRDAKRSPILQYNILHHTSRQSAALRELLKVFVLTINEELDDLINCVLESLLDCHCRLPGIRVGVFLLTPKELKNLSAVLIADQVAVLEIDRIKTPALITSK